MMPGSRQDPMRKGVAAVWALVVIAVTSALVCTAILQLANARKQVDDNQTRMQTRWLVRSGFELAMEGLLANPEQYEGETAALIPGTKVKISVERPGEVDGVYRVTCVATSGEGQKVVVLSDRRHIKLEKTVQGMKGRMWAEGADSGL